MMLLQRWHVVADEVYGAFSFDCSPPAAVSQLSFAASHGLAAGLLAFIGGYLLGAYTTSALLSFVDRRRLAAEAFVSEENP